MTRLLPDPPRPQYRATAWPQHSPRTLLINSFETARLQPCPAKLTRFGLQPLGCSLLHSSLEFQVLLRSSFSAARCWFGRSPEQQNRCPKTDKDDVGDSAKGRLRGYVGRESVRQPAWGRGVLPNEKNNAQVAGSWKGSGSVSRAPANIAA